MSWHEHEIERIKAESKAEFIKNNPIAYACKQIAEAVSIVLMLFILAQCVCNGCILPAPPESLALGHGD